MNKTYTTNQKETEVDNVLQSLKQKVKVHVEGRTLEGILLEVQGGRMCFSVKGLRGFFFWRHVSSITFDWSRPESEVEITLSDYTYDDASKTKYDQLLEFRSTTSPLRK